MCDRLRALWRGRGL